MGNLTDPGKSPGLAWLIAHKDYPHADFCLIWPFARLNNGYGSTTRDGHFERAHRLMCEMIHGPAPAERPFAAHTCNRGHEGCVNPHHLVWKNQEENEADKTHEIGRRKLTIDQAREIRAAKGLERPLDTARRFNTSFSNVIAIQQGRTWKEDKRRVSDDAVIAIRASSEPVADLAARFGCSQSVVYRIRNGKSYTHVCDLGEGGSI